MSNATAAIIFVAVSLVVIAAAVLIVRGYYGDRAGGSTKEITNQGVERWPTIPRSIIPNSAPRPKPGSGRRRSRSLLPSRLPKVDGPRRTTWPRARPSAPRPHA
jgi:hypothetical protein